MQPASISGVVYQDLDGDGAFEAGLDAVLGGAMLTLTDSQNGSVVATTTSDPDGTYSFIDCSAGTLHVGRIAARRTSALPPLTISALSTAISDGFRQR